MKKTFFIVALIISVQSFGQDNKHTIDLKYKNCIENAVPTTIGGINCAKEATEDWTLEMATILEKLKNDDKLMDVALLEESQIKWLAFHKSNVKFYYSFYQIQYQGGTMARSAALSYEMRHLRERVLYLEELYKEIGGE